MTDDLSTPCRPVRLLARSQSSTFHVTLACIFPSCSLPFSWYVYIYIYIRPQHFPQYAFLLHPSSSHPRTSSIVSPCLFGSLRHSRCASYVFVPDLVFACISHIHRSILISFTSIRFSCRFVVAYVSAPYK